MTKLYEMVMYICLIAVLGVIYFGCFNAAYDGYGYPGHRGYHSHCHTHFWYIRNYDESYVTSAREDSVGGNKFSKRGLSGGK